ncbi:MAG: hypothetical protein ACT4NT_01400 [Nitrososphaerota archaeon]
MTKSLIVIISAILLVSTGIAYQDTYALEQKRTTDKKTQTDTTTQTNSKIVSKQDRFGNDDDPFFSIVLPDGWSKKTNFPFSFASAETDGNHILVDSYVPVKSFSSRDDIHSYLKLTDLSSGGFGLGNSIMTVDTNYGYKTVVELKFTKQDGNQMMLRKDFHFMSKEGMMYSVHGFSSDPGSFNTLKSALNTFKPLT